MSIAAASFHNNSWDSIALRRAGLPPLVMSGSPGRTPRGGGGETSPSGSADERPSPVGWAAEEATESFRYHGGGGGGPLTQMHEKDASALRQQPWGICQLEDSMHGGRHLQCTSQGSGAAQVDWQQRQGLRPVAETRQECDDDLENRSGKHHDGTILQKLSALSFGTAPLSAAKSSPEEQQHRQAEEQQRALQHSRRGVSQSGSPVLNKAAQSSQDGAPSLAACRSATVSTPVFASLDSADDHSPPGSPLDHTIPFFGSRAASFPAYSNPAHSPSADAIPGQCFRCGGAETCPSCHTSRAKSLQGTGQTGSSVDPFDCLSQEEAMGWLAGPNSVHGVAGHPAHHQHMHHLHQVAQASLAAGAGAWLPAREQLDAAAAHAASGGASSAVAMDALDAVYSVPIQQSQSMGMPEHHRLHSFALEPLNVHGDAAPAPFGPASAPASTAHPDMNLGINVKPMSLGFGNQSMDSSSLSLSQDCSDSRGNVEVTSPMGEGPSSLTLEQEVDSAPSPQFGSLHTPEAGNGNATDPAGAPQFGFPASPNAAGLLPPLGAMGSAAVPVPPGPGTARALFNSPAQKPRLRPAHMTSPLATSSGQGMRQGLSSFFGGKSRSFTSLADVATIGSIQELAKPVRSYNRRRRLSGSGSKDSPSPRGPGGEGCGRNLGLRLGGGGIGREQRGVFKKALSGRQGLGIQAGLAIALAMGELDEQEQQQQEVSEPHAAEVGGGMDRMMETVMEETPDETPAGGPGADTLSAGSNDGSSDGRANSADASGSRGPGTSHTGADFFGGGSFHG